MLPQIGTQGRPLELLIIQPTPFCNLDCDYCYLPFRHLKHRIATEVLEKIFERTFASGFSDGGFTVVWHAGEPLVLPPLFYREARAVIARHNPKRIHVRHSFQTNATLLSPEWCEFLLESESQIGVSIDGPDFIHDRHRQTRGGKGTCERVLRGIELLQKHGIDFHVITVLTQDSLDYPDELFEFYLAHGMRRIGFNVEEIEGVNRTSSLLGEAVYERVTAFMSRFYDLVAESGERFSVREFDSDIAALLSGGGDERCGPQQTTPFAILSVDCHGNFSTYSPELLGLTSEQYGDFTFGNVMTDSFESMLASQKFQAVARDIAAGVHRCRETCAYFPYCGGGAPVNKYFENGSFDSTETMFCRLSKKAIVDVLLDKLEAQASRPVQA